MKTYGDVKALCEMLNRDLEEERAHRIKEMWARFALWFAVGGLCSMLFALAAFVKGP